MAKLKKILLFLIIFLLLIIIAEISLHLLGCKPSFMRDLLRFNVAGELLGEYDSALFWRLKGVEPSFPQEDNDGLVKIICLTDSVSVMYQGRGYPDILEEKLNNWFKSYEVAVFNAGVPGYTSFQGLKYFKNELIEYNPDFIIVCYGWNDHWRSANGLEDKQQEIKLNKFFKFLLNKSCIFSYLNKTVLELRKQGYDCVPENSNVRVSLKDYSDNLDKFINLAKEHNIGVILMTAPYLEKKQEWLKMHKQYNQQVRVVARKNDVTLVDLVEKFRRQKQLFLNPETDSCHYNWRGSKIIARALADKIKQQLADSK
jgi:lysophospholipase L1-like esterase